MHSQSLVSIPRFRFLWSSLALTSSSASSVACPFPWRRQLTRARGEFRKQWERGRRYRQVFARTSRRAGCECAPSCQSRHPLSPLVFSSPLVVSSPTLARSSHHYRSGCHHRSSVPSPPVNRLEPPCWRASETCTNVVCTSPQGIGTTCKNLQDNKVYA